jgi:hypothetical protein
MPERDMTDANGQGQRARLLVTTDGVWSASDFGAFLLAIEGMYSVLGLILWATDPEVGSEMPWGAVQHAILARLTEDAPPAGPRPNHDDLAESTHIGDLIGMPHGEWGLSHLRIVSLEMRSPGRLVFEGFDRAVAQVQALVVELLERDAQAEKLPCLGAELRALEIDVARAAVARAGVELPPFDGATLPRSVRLLASWSQRVCMLVQERRLRVGDAA